ncbi:hypothetical protein AVEN_107735-1 [Araneus ventricosus]|uniref:Uncharacterized protein n=1 Tax=Araneus ventricosus TaxID=182803 RepID=A0A4Y2J0L0_ARAVE|nr:hypothetical protein AVEN_107735-1 [Araneus ventricosus]
MLGADGLNGGCHPIPPNGRDDLVVRYQLRDRKVQNLILAISVVYVGLNLTSEVKHSPASVVWKFIVDVGVQVSSSSSNDGSKVQGPS